MKLWKRNAVVAAIVLFVCVAVYLNWSYHKDTADTGKILGQATLVGGQTSDPLLAGQEGDPDAGLAADQTAGQTADQTVGQTDGQTAGQTDGVIAPTGDSTDVQLPAAASGTGYFASARLNRQQARDGALSILQQTADSADADQAMKDEAGQAIQTLAGFTVSEAQIENLVTAKGYADCVVFISDNSISVVVSATADGLTDADVAKITEIVTGETSYSASQIKIMEATA